jgi:hypothetical protein
MGGPASGVCHYWKQDGRPERYADLAPSTREALDSEVRALLEAQRSRIASMLAGRDSLLKGMRDQLMMDRVIDACGLAKLVRMLAPDLAAAAERLENLPVSPD